MVEKPPEPGRYDAIIIAVAHDEFKAMTESEVRLLGKTNHILYDIKYVLNANQVDGRL